MIPDFWVKCLKVKIWQQFNTSLFLLSKHFQHFCTNIHKELSTDLMWGEPMEDTETFMSELGRSIIRQKS